MTLKKFSAHLEHALERMGPQENVFANISDMLMSTPLDVVVLAIGKSGYIGQKFSASLRSVGVPTYFLHAAEAGHGDIGNIRRGQIVIAISKSGTTAEIISLIPELRKRDCFLISITNREASPLAQMSDLKILTCVEQEGEPLNTVPLVSVQAALFACDYLVSLVCTKRTLSREDFLSNHPAGQIGSNLRYKLKDFIDLQTRRSICVLPNDTAMQALLVTTKGRVGAVGVTDVGKRIQGYLTDGDFRRLAGRGLDLNSVLVGEVMNASPIFVNGEMLVGDVLSLFENAAPPIASAPIVDDNGLFLGLVSIHDLIRPAHVLS
tara:strand:- start:846 stop:1808 length:963 start_codon:yes stop_codon:yes gene_type:complete